MALKSFYASSFFQALAEGLIKPFIPIFARSLGATNTFVGLISAIPNFVNTFSQVIWGTIADMYDKKKLMIIVGGIIADIISIWHVFIISMFLRITAALFVNMLEERTGSKPRGVFNLEFDYSGISEGLEMFITTYSMVIYVFKDRGKKFMNIGKYVKVFVNNR